MDLAQRPAHHQERPGEPVSGHAQVGPLSTWVPVWSGTGGPRGCPCLPGTLPNRTPCQHSPCEAEQAQTSSGMFTADH